MPQKSLSAAVWNPISDLLDLRLSIFQVEVLLARQSAKRGASYIGYYGGILGAHSRINMNKYIYKYVTTCCRSQFAKSISFTSFRMYSCVTSAFDGCNYSWMGEHKPNCNRGAPPCNNMGGIESLIESNWGFRGLATLFKLLENTKVIGIQNKEAGLGMIHCLLARKCKSCTCLSQLKFLCRTREIVPRLHTRMILSYQCCKPKKGKTTCI